MSILGKISNLLAKAGKWVVSPSRQPVSVSRDLTLDIPICLTPHDYLGTTGKIPAPASYTLEAPVPVFWPPGMTLGQNKLAMTVLHGSAPVAQKDHDCGYAIPHVTVVPPPPAINAKNVSQTAFSGRATKVVAPAVQVGGSPIAANCGVPVVMKIPAPMMSCADPMDVPLGTTVTNMFATVTFGLTWANLLSATAKVAMNIGFGKLFGGFFNKKKAPGEAIADEIVKSLSKKEVLQALGEELLNKLKGDDLVKNLAGLATSTVCFATSGLKKGAWKFGVGTPLLGSIELAAEWKDGKFEVSMTSRSELIKSGHRVDKNDPSIKPKEDDIFVNKDASLASADERKYSYTFGEGRKTEYSNTDYTGKKETVEITHPKTAKNENDGQPVDTRGTASKTANQGMYSNLLGWSNYGKIKGI